MAGRGLARPAEFPYGIQVGDEELEFEWDADKADSNLDKHGVSFEMATFVFDDPFRLEEEDLFARGEYRFLVTGLVDGLLLMVVCTFPEDGVVRLISARLATASERRAYDQSRFQT